MPAGKNLEEALEEEERKLEDLKGTMHAAMERVQASIEKLKHDEAHLERERQKLAADEEEVRERSAEVSKLREELANGRSRGGFLCCMSRPDPSPEIIVPEK